MYHLKPFPRIIICVNCALRLNLVVFCGNIEWIPFVQIAWLLRCYWERADRILRHTVVGRAKGKYLGNTNYYISLRWYEFWLVSRRIGEPQTAQIYILFISEKFLEQRPFVNLYVFRFLVTKCLGWIFYKSYITFNIYYFSHLYFINGTVLKLQQLTFFALTFRFQLAHKINRSSGYGLLPGVSECKSDLFL